MSSTTADCSYFVYIRSLKTLGPPCLSLPQLLSSAILLFFSIRFETLISDTPLFSKHRAFWPNIYRNCYLYYCLCIILVNSWFCCDLSDRQWLSLCWRSKLWRSVPSTSRGPKVTGRYASRYESLGHFISVPFFLK